MISLGQVAPQIVTWVSTGRHEGGGGFTSRIYIRAKKLIVNFVCLLVYSFVYSIVYCKITLQVYKETELIRINTGFRKFV